MQALHIALLVREPAHLVNIHANASLNPREGLAQDLLA
jgi:hypothetical protein